jgi:hypothetical protein
MSKEVDVGKAAAGDRLNVHLVFRSENFSREEKEEENPKQKKKEEEKERVRKSTAAPLLERQRTRRMSGVCVDYRIRQ